MGDLKTIPFQSFQILRDWRKSEEANTYTDEWLDKILVPGFEYYFKSSKSPVISVFDHVDPSEKPLYVDIHVELRSKDGKIHQPWLLTFICPKGVLEENQKYSHSSGKIETIDLPTLNTPFPYQDILWECDHFTPDEIVKMMTAWSDQVWPDFNPTFRYGLASDEEFQWIRNLFSQIDKENLPNDEVTFIEQISNSELFIIGSKENLGEDLLGWLEEKGYPTIPTGDGDEIAIMIPPDLREIILEKWPDLNFRPAFQLDYD